MGGSRLAILAVPRENSCGIVGGKVELTQAPLLLVLLSAPKGSTVAAGGMEKILSLLDALNIGKHTEEC